MNDFKDLYRFVVDTANDFATYNAPTLGAALAFYTALALAPMLMIFMFIAGLIGP
jgi:uncharacterized BrkB/YihY/UPF0761 family membrane protein